MLLGKSGIVIHHTLSRVFRLQMLDLVFDTDSENRFAY